MFGKLHRLNKRGVVSCYGFRVQGNKRWKDEDCCEKECRCRRWCRTEVEGTEDWVHLDCDTTKNSEHNRLWKGMMDKH